MKRLAQLGLLTATLAGCAGAGQQASDSVPPNYREIILASRTTLFKDPDSVRDATLGTPQNSIFGWTVCMKANAKNGFGGFTGQETYRVVIYRNGNPPIMQAPTIYDGCGSDYYEPFHEIEGNYAPPATKPAPVAPIPAKPRKPAAT